MEGMKKVEVLRAACCVAGIDGDVTTEERKIIDMLAADVGVGQASVDAMVERAKEDQGFYKEQFRVLKSDPKETLQLLFSLAISDGRLGNREKQVIWRLAKRLDVDQASFQQWAAQAEAYVKKKNQPS